MVFDKERVYEKIAFIREQIADIHSLIGEKPVVALQPLDMFQVAASAPYYAR